MAAADPVGLPCQHVLALPSPCPRLLPRWAFAHLCPSYVLLYLVRPPLPHPPPPFFLQCPPGDPVQPEPLLKRQTQGTQSESPTPSTVLRPQAAHPRGLQAVPPGPAPASSLASSTSHCPSAPFLCQAPGRALEIRSRNLTVPSSRSWFCGCTRTASEKSQASFTNEAVVVATTLRGSRTHRCPSVCTGWGRGPFLGSVCCAFLCLRSVLPSAWALCVFR